MSKVRLYGSTSGYIELAAPAVAPDSTLTLPPTFAGIGTNVVSARPTAVFTTTSLTYTPVTNMTVTITPTSATSNVLVLVGFSMSMAATSVDGVVRLLRDSTPVGNGAEGFFAKSRGLVSTSQTYANLAYVDSPATASAVTYSIEAQLGGSSTLTIGGQAGSPSEAGSQYIVAIEVAA